MQKSCHFSENLAKNTSIMSKSTVKKSIPVAMQKF